MKRDLFIRGFESTLNPRFDLTGTQKAPAACGLEEREDGTKGQNNANPHNKLKNYDRTNRKNKSGDCSGDPSIAFDVPSKKSAHEIR